MANFDDIKKRASLPTDTVALCLAGEMVEEIGRLEQQLADAKPPVSLGDASPKRLIAEQIVALQEQMREATAEFHLRAMGARAWTMFWSKLPDRADGESAEVWDARIFPFYAELVSRSCVDPEMSVEQVAELADLLHGSAWNRLARACMMLNNGTVDVPNSVAASELTEGSGQT